MRKRVLYAAFWGIVLSFLLLLYWCFIVSYGKGPINWRNASIFPVPDTVYVHDTVKIIAPTATSETLIRVDTVWFERANKTSNKLANIGKDNKIYVASKNEPKEEADTVGKLSANYMQVNYGNVPEKVDSGAYSDSVPVSVPITQRVYKDSTCTVWVSGYNPAVDSVHVYRSVAYYPVVSDKEYEPPNIVVSIGTYMGFGNKGFNYGIALTVGVPIELKKVIRRL